MAVRVHYHEKQSNLHHVAIYQIKEVRLLFYSCMTDKFSGVVGIPLATPIRVKIGVVWKKGKYISNDMQTLLNFTKNYYKKHPLITERDS